MNRSSVDPVENTFSGTLEVSLRSDDDDEDDEDDVFL